MLKKLKPKKKLAQVKQAKKLKLVNGIQGIVISALGADADKPISGAMVAILKRSWPQSIIKTKGNGKFKSVLDPGRYQIRVRAEGFDDVSTTVTVLRGFAEVAIEMAPVATEGSLGFPGYDKAPERSIDYQPPGSGVARRIAVRDVGGVAVLNGFQVLGPMADLETAAPLGMQGGLFATQEQPLINGFVPDTRLWDMGIVPYRFDGLPRWLAIQFEDAMDFLRSFTGVRFVPRHDETHYVRIRPGHENTGYASLGVTPYVKVDLSTPFSDHVVHREGQDIVVGANAYPFDIMKLLLTTLGIGRFQVDPSGPIEPPRPGEAPGDDIWRMSLNDRQALSQLYPLTLQLEGGMLWGSGNDVTGIAVTSSSTSNFDTLVVTRKASANGRVFVHRGVGAGGRPLAPAIIGRSWSRNRFATCAAAATIQQGAPPAFAYGLNGGGGDRFVVAEAGYESFPKFTGGGNWGADIGVAAIAMGMDADGLGLIAVARDAAEGARVHLYLHDNGETQEIWHGCNEWGRGYKATDIAVGDFDGDGKLEFAVTRNAQENERFLVYKAQRGDYSNMSFFFGGGRDWGEDAYATAVCFGDMNGDGAQELGVARFTTVNERFFVYGGPAAGFPLLHSGGAEWGEDAYAVDIAMGDMDGDGRAELAVARTSPTSTELPTNFSQVFFFDDAEARFQPIASAGHLWGEHARGSGVALSDGERSPGNVYLTRSSPSGLRYAGLNYNVIQSG